jgi:hypothetical protein
VERYCREASVSGLRINCNPDGGMEIDDNFFVDLRARPSGPARGHEVRLQGGDCSTEIFQ